jgi:hypothetical protein
MEISRSACSWYTFWSWIYLSESAVMSGMVPRKGRAPMFYKTTQLPPGDTCTFISPPNIIKFIFVYIICLEVYTKLMIYIVFAVCGLLIYCLYRECEMIRYIKWKIFVKSNLPRMKSSLNLLNIAPEYLFTGTFYSDNIQ